MTTHSERGHSTDEHVYLIRCLRPDSTRLLNKNADAQRNNRNYFDFFVRHFFSLRLPLRRCYVLLRLASLFRKGGEKSAARFD